MVDAILVDHEFYRHFQPVTALFAVRRKRCRLGIEIISNAVITILTRKGGGGWAGGGGRVPAPSPPPPFPVLVSRADSGKCFNLAFRLALLVTTGKHSKCPTP